MKTSFKWIFSFACLVGYSGGIEAQNYHTVPPVPFYIAEKKPVLYLPEILGGAKGSGGASVIVKLGSNGKIIDYSISRLVLYNADKRIIDYNKFDNNSRINNNSEFKSLNALIHNYLLKLPFRRNDAVLAKKENEVFIFIKFNK